MYPANQYEHYKLETKERLERARRQREAEKAQVQKRKEGRG